MKLKERIESALLCLAGGGLVISKGEAEALLFHYHKRGIPETQTAAKALEQRLCDFVEKETWEPVELVDATKGSWINVAGRSFEIKKIDGDGGVFVSDASAWIETHLTSQQLASFGYRANTR